MNQLNNNNTMKKSVIKLALDALELRLMQNRQDAKRDGNFADYDNLNELLESVRETQKELAEIDGETLTILI